MRRFLLPGTLAVALAWGTASELSAQDVGTASSGAVLQGLDKVTARISTFEAPFDVPVRFGSLVIQARACHKAPPTEPPESTAFIEIDETFETALPRDLFTGWMFASSPAVSALEHPVYDVWVVDCMKASNSASDSSG
ncbi:MAG: DUF2155 domain-containing protein [Rhodospirillaceae bacterium]|jgi:hypothetical protein|nr:DUF2155 domain-containing protein [Rhodospirillaceae bacterium]MBT6404440.1 DUF2155 domain-containing protein [Rhodospirillaceae bacterium]MBT6536421.1 DUF2155 domain-containing protein [Rhodospirillaceae bacterium]MBT7361469.1 DUF2155 domain-containing protein [Rhodospirillaceae bacterium]